MTATEELHRLLYAHGVKWLDYQIDPHMTRTSWGFGTGIIWCADHINGMINLEISAYVTPEQAVEATLGRGTCRILEDDDTGMLTCSECGAVQPEDFTSYYCWSCGAKVVS